MGRLAVDDALEDVVLFDPDRHHHKFIRQLARGEIVSYPLGRRRLGCAPVCRKQLQHVRPRFDEAALDIEVQPSILEVVDVPEDIRSVSRLLEHVK